MLRHCLLFIGLIALWITSCSRTPEYTDSAARLAERIVPSHSDDFIFTLVPAEKDFFELRQNGDKIEIQGNNGISMARGLNHYLRHYCHASVSWCGDNLASIPDTLPAVGEPVHIEASQPLRYYLNYCTYSYSMAFWGVGRMGKRNRPHGPTRCQSPSHGCQQPVRRLAKHAQKTGI